MRPLRPVALALLLALLALAPLAQAQAGLVQPTVTVTIEDPGRALVPGRNESIPMSVNYLWSPGAQPAPDPGTQNRTANTTIRLTIVQLPSWILDAHIYPEVVEVEFPAQVALGGNRVVNDISINLTLDPLAPALQREEIIVLAEAEPNGNLAGASAQNPGTKIRAEVVPILNVTAERMVVVPGGRWASVPFTIRNEGNSDLVATLDLALAPENSETRFPEQVEIKRGESVVVEVEIRLPWTEAEIGTLELEATPVLTEEEGKPATATVEIQGTSAVPGPGLAPLLLALLALAARRRRA